MAYTLIVNTGSSSKKYALFTAGRLHALYRFERQGDVYEVLIEIAAAHVATATIDADRYDAGLAYVVADVASRGLCAVADIGTVGVRVVAPGTYFQQHQCVDDEYMTKLSDRIPAAPLHIPAVLHELAAVQAVLPQAIIVGVSDSAFHSTMPKEAREYAIAAADTKAHDLYRFGYHGLSGASIARRLPILLPPAARRVVVCHIGSGMSMTALRDGVSMDTTMGFGPGSGLMMGARAGDVEPAVVLELMRQRGFTSDVMQSYLQQEGGFVGQLGQADWRYLLERYATADITAVETLTMCRYRIEKTIGAYQAALEGIDALVLTATAMERNPELRTLLFGRLGWLGATIDPVRNDTVVGRDGIISTATSPVLVAVVRTDEMGEMLRVVEALGV